MKKQTDELEIFSFSLIFDRLDLNDDEVLDALFESHCDDALPMVVRGVHVLRFGREATTFLEAVTSAVDDVLRAAPAARLVAIDGPSNVVTASEVADFTGRSDESIRLLVAGKRREGSFPLPVARVEERSPLLRTTDVVRALVDESEISAEQADLAEYVNCSLALRSNLTPLADRQIIDEAIVCWEVEPPSQASISVWTGPSDCAVIEPSCSVAVRQTIPAGAKPE